MLPLAHGDRCEEAQAEVQGIRGVPFFVLEDGTQLSGAQPKGALLNALRASWNKSCEAFSFVGYASP